MPVVKRYPNRKLYDTEAKRYVTLNEIARMIRAGDEVVVVDHETNEDLTAVTLSQIIFEQEKQQGGFLPKAVLTNLVRAGGDTITSLRKGLTLPLDLWHQVDEEIDRRIQDLTSRGELAREEGLRLRSKLLSPIHFSQEALGSDERSIEMLLDSHDVPSREELERLHAELQVLSAKLDNMIKQAEVKEAAVPDQETG
ncbi:MAG: polyhydroxyalkanoate synthesis regulator DNA-binding domain-containing protein [Chloroflexota bacterium]